MFFNSYKLQYLKLSASMTNVNGGDVCFNIGSVDYPCVVDAPEGFDFGVDTSGNYFIWNDGYFKLLGSEVAQKEPYVVLSTDSTTLSFYYDEMKSQREGVFFDLELDKCDNYLLWESYKDEITKIIFDASFAVAKPLSLDDWFSNMSKLTHIVGIENLDITNVESLYGLFLGCSSLVSLDLSSFDTSNVRSMQTMFFGCRNLTSLDVSSFDTSSVIDMSQMFCGCEKLRELDVSSFITTNVTEMVQMFADCHELKSLDVSNFDTSKVN